MSYLTSLLQGDMYHVCMTVVSPAVGRDDEDDLIPTDEIEGSEMSFGIGGSDDDLDDM